MIVLAQCHVRQVSSELDQNLSISIKYDTDGQELNIHCTYENNNNNNKCLHCVDLKQKKISLLQPRLLKI